MDNSTRDAQGNAGEHAAPSAGKDALENAGLRELARRMAIQRFGPRMAGWTGPAAEPQLFVGQSPPDFPFELAQPEGSHMVGSVVVGDRTEVYLNAAQPARDVLNFYRDRLREGGWTTPPMGRPGGGFQPSMWGSANSLLFCKGEDDAALTVQAFDAQEKLTQVYLDLNTFAEHPEFSPCSRQQRMRRMGRPDSDVFPPLAPPLGGQVRPEGGGGGNGRWYSSAVLQGDVLLADVRADYERQLQDAGWTRLTSDAAGPVTWSSWSFSDDEKRPWQATLLILQQTETPRSYFLLLRGETEGSQSGFRSGGTVSYGPLMPDGTRTASAVNIIGTQIHYGPSAPPEQQERTEPKPSETQEPGNGGAEQ